jgi:hypothetical protein
MTYNHDSIKNRLLEWAANMLPKAAIGLSLDI